ncbi:MAG: rsxB 1 [Firmicutes bacterium]|nr:rsxB 1 [Bacillota bacterium]
MPEYFHSVRLDAERCKGCVTCIRRCPTEAIRIRGGKARIIESRCIDCGECIRRCPNHAKRAVTDNFIDLKRYKYNIALPAPTLYAQFSPDIGVNKILCGLIKIGFDAVYEVACGAEVVSAAVREYLAQNEYKRPLISSACPAVVKLIQVKFPELIEHLVPIDAPVEVTAKMARTASRSEHNLTDAEIGIWFITPCPAKMTEVRQPLGSDKSAVTGTIAITEIYGSLLKAIGVSSDNEVCSQASIEGLGWAIAGGETGAAAIKRSIVVHEIHSVNEILEQITLGKLSDIDYIEALACAGGCIGGPLTVENRFIAENNMRKRLEKMGSERGKIRLPVDSSKLLAQVKREFEPRSSFRLDEDIVKAMKKIELMQETMHKLPGLDCGSCGSPNCQALAEDIVQGGASETDCVFKLRERVRDLAKEMIDLAEKVPQSMPKYDPERDGGDGI